MTPRLLIASALLLVSMPGLSGRGAENSPLPVRDGRPVVATVGDGAIALDEFLLQLDPAGDRARLLQGRATAAELEVLQRLVTIRLMVLEATTMGLGDLPEIRKQVEVTSRQILRDVLTERLTKDVVADAAAVEKAYKDKVREWKTAALLFTDEVAAKAAREAIAKGATFEAIASKAIADAKAKADTDQEYHQQKDYLPQIASAIAALETGQVSPVIRLDTGFVVVKVLDIRYPEKADVRAEVTKVLLGERQLAALKAHEEELRAANVVIHKDVIDGVDYEAATPNLEALMKDTRVIAEIKGAAPFTVADLTDYLRMQAYHGDDNVAQGKRYNSRKQAALDATVARRLLNAEALRLGIDATPEYIDRINGYEESLVFNSFVQRVIVPDNKMREEEVKAYYDAHTADYSTPGMLRVRSLAFTKRAAAEAATEKLRAGTDFAWLAANAEDQAARDTPDLLVFDGRPVMTDSMPEGVQKVLRDTSAGDVRLYADGDGPYYALVVQDRVAREPRPYAEVRDEIARKLFGEKLKTAVETYATRLRAQVKVEVFVKKAE